MYLCVRGVYFASFYDFNNLFWNCSDIVVFCCFLFLFFFTTYTTTEDTMYRCVNFKNSICIVTSDRNGKSQSR